MNATSPTMKNTAPSKPRPKLNLMKKIKNWAEKTSFHAVPHIAATKNNLIKFIWVVFLLISTGFCGYLLISESVRFFSFNVNTVVQITRDSAAKFPAVTVCPIMQCGFENYDFQKYFDIYTQEKFNASGYLNKSQLEMEIEKVSVSTLFDETKKRFLKNHSKDDLLKVLKSNASMKPYMISCQYSSEYCYEKDFEYVQFDAFTRCFK